MLGSLNELAGSFRYMKFTTPCFQGVFTCQFITRLFVFLLSSSIRVSNGAHFVFSSVILVIKFFTSDTLFVSLALRE
ncbi:hypothetical protein AGMMS50256_31810 [Betaproteobacteria bacterium]|nr:hypothetical protein AGMMS50256_31810 [Betaproteobacteria bacterium]